MTEPSYTGAHNMRKDMTIHLDSGPRDPIPLCGGEGETTTDHLKTTCPQCIDMHGEALEAQDYRELREELSLFWDSYDAYGSLMCAWFPLCYVLEYERGTSEPSLEWGYSPGAGGPAPEDRDSLYSEVYREYSTDVLLKLGRVFNRYYGRLKSTGRTY